MQPPSNPSFVLNMQLPTLPHPTYRLCGAHATSVTGDGLVGCIVRERDDGTPRVHVGAKPLDHGHQGVGGCGHSGEVALQGAEQQGQIYGSRYGTPEK